MCTKLAPLVVALRSLSRSVDIATFSPTEVAQLFSEASELERLAGALKLMAAPRLGQSSEWARAGHRSPEEWMARTSGVGVGEAKRILETAEKLDGLEATQQALRSGELSLAQAGAVAEAAVARPDSEADLLTLAGREPVRRLRDAARRVVLDAQGSVEERYARQRKLRSFRHWIDEEGMVAGRFRLPPDVGSALVKTVQREADRHFRRSHREGRREPADAYAADALVGLVTGEALGPRGKRANEVVVVVSYDALRRGFADPTASEFCEVPGFGAVSVSRARQLLGDAFLKGVVADGTRITHVRHFGRHRPAEVDTALLATAVISRGKVECCVEACGRTVGIEWDHAVALSRGGPTSAANLQPMCAFHNRQKGAGASPARAGPAP